MREGRGISLQFFLNDLIQPTFRFHKPAWHSGIQESPMTLTGLLHPEHDSISAVIHHIHMEQFIGRTGNLPEIKLPHEAVHFKITGELYIFYDLQIHTNRVGKVFISILMQKTYKAFTTIHNVKNFPDSGKK